MSTFLEQLVPGAEDDIEGDIGLWIEKMMRSRVLAAALIAGTSPVILAPAARADDLVTYEVVSDTVPTANGIEYFDGSTRRLLQDVPLPWRTSVPTANPRSVGLDGAEVRAAWRDLMPRPSGDPASGSPYASTSGRSCGAKVRSVWVTLRAMAAHLSIVIRVVTDGGAATASSTVARRSHVMLRQRCCDENPHAAVHSAIIRIGPVRRTLAAHVASAAGPMPPARLGTSQRAFVRFVARS